MNKKLHLQWTFGRLPGLRKKVSKFGPIVKHQPKNQCNTDCIGLTDFPQVQRPWPETIISCIRLYTGKDALPKRRLKDVGDLLTNVRAAEAESAHQRQRRNQSTNNHPNQGPVTENRMHSSKDCFLKEEFNRKWQKPTCNQKRHFFLKRTANLKFFKFSIFFCPSISCTLFQFCKHRNRLAQCDRGADFSVCSESLDPHKNHFRSHHHTTNDKLIIIVWSIVW